MKKAPKKYLVILALGLILTVSLLVWTKPVRQLDLKETPPTHVTTTQVQQQDIKPTEKVTGRLQAAQKAVLHFELAGQLLKRHVEPGQRVELGQLLLELGDGDYQDALAEAKSALQQERAAAARDRQLLSLASRERELQVQAVARFERLGQQSLVSQSQRDEAQARLLQLQTEEARLRYSVTTAAATLEQRETAVSRAQRNLERARLTAPFAGIINQVFVEVGDYVVPNTAALELLDSEFLDLYVEVPSAVAAAVTLGQQVEVRIGGKMQQADIVAVQTDPNPATGTYAVRMRMPSQGTLPGELAEVTLARTLLQGALVLPVTAVLQEEGKAYVFLVQGKVLKRTEVVLGPRIQDVQVIESGVGVGDTVVAHSIAALADGERVVAQAQ